MEPAEPIYKIPPTEPKKSWLSSHMILGVLFVVAILAAIIAVIYYWQTVRVIPSKVQLPEHQDPTASWQTYVNRQYGFEIKYPKDWYTEELDGIFWIRNSKLKVYDGGGVKPEGEEGVDWVRGYEIYLAEKPVKNVSLTSEGEYQVKKLNYPHLEAYSISGDVPSSGLDVYIKDPYLTDSFINLGYHNGNDFQQIDRIFSSLLSSFKFDDEVFCGGIAGFPCPTTGFTCVSQGNYPDAGTICTRKK